MGLTVTSLKAQNKSSQKQRLIGSRPKVPNPSKILPKPHGVKSPNTVPAKIMGNNKYSSVYTTMNTGSNPLTANVNKIFKLSSGKFVVLSSRFVFVWDGNTNWQRIKGFNGSPTAVDEDSNHNIWIGTTSGVYEFDSQYALINNYSLYGKSGHKLAVNALSIDSKDSVWVGARVGQTFDTSTSSYVKYGGGIFLINGIATQVLDTLIDGEVNAVKAMQDGTIWFAGSKLNSPKNDKLVIYDTAADTTVSYSMSNGTLPRNGIGSIQADSSGNKWITLFDYGGEQSPIVSKYNGSSWTNYNQSDGIPYGNPESLSVFMDGSVYYSSADSTVKFSDSQWALVSNGNSKFPLREVSSVTKDNSGDIMFSAVSYKHGTGGGIHVYNGSSWKFISSFNDGGLFSNIIFGSTVDHDGNLWVSGFYGVGKYDGNTWTYYNTSDGLAENYNWRLLTARDGTIWLSGSGASQSDTNMVTSFKNGTFTKHDLGNQYHESLFEDSNGNIWFGSFESNGVAKYDGSNVTIYGKKDGVNLDVVEGIGEDAQGNIYLAGDIRNGSSPIYKYDGSNWTPLMYKGSINYHAYDMASDSSGNLFVAVRTSDNSGIVVWKGSGYKAYTLYDPIRYITPLGNGSALFSGASYNILHDTTLYRIHTHYEGFLYTSTIANDQSIWSGTYGGGLIHYKSSVPVELTSINDYANDQGGWVTLHISGFLLDPTQTELASQWTVWRQNGNNWESAGTTPITKQKSEQVSVPVPTTMPTGSTSSQYKYLFKVSVENSIGMRVAQSDTMSGFALDNKAPAKVSGVQLANTNGGVTVSWASVNAPDLENYQVFAWNGSSYDKTKPLATTQGTQATISDSKISSKNLVVVARDIHNNYGQASDPIMLTAISDTKSNVPKHFALKQNYQNPFNPTTNIRYDLPKRADVTLEVYNVVGKKVATLVNGTKAAGSYSVTFDASHISSGLYFYRLHAGKFTKVESMTLIK